METILVNLEKPRRETRNGRDYLVAPATLIVSDRILNGSLGPGLYPASDVEANVQSWDGMPIIVWHPTEKVENDEGEVEEVHISARDPDVLDQWGVGNVWRNRAVDGKHRAEMWFDVAATQRIDNKLVDMGIDPIYPKLINGEPIELSTGLDPVKQPAPKGAKLQNGERYTWIARQPFNPDHVAVLPDQKGACSVDDGCGVNNAGNASVLRPTAMSGMDEAECRNSDECVENFLKNQAVENLMATNARMCWGKPCDQGPSAPDEKSGAADRGSSSSKHTLQSAQGLSMKANITGDKSHHTEAAEAYESLAKDADADAAKAEASGDITGQINHKNKAAIFRSSGAAHVKKSGRTNNKTINKGRPMTKTKFNRKRELAFVTANCACKDRAKLKAFNNLPDEALEQVANATRITLVVNAARAGKLPKPVVNAEGEGEAVAGVPWTKLAQLLGVEIDPRQDPVGFAAELKSKLDEIGGKLGGAPTPPPPSDEEEPTMNEDEVNNEDEEKPVANKQLTEKDWMRQAPKSVRNRLAYLDKLERSEKQKLVNRLLVNVKGKDKRQKIGEKLFNLSIDELNERLEMLGNREQEDQDQQRGSGINWAFNSSAPQQHDQEQIDSIAEMMTPAPSMLSIVNAAREDRQSA